MAATARILNIWCLRAATGTDAAVANAVAGLAPSVALNDLGGRSLEDFS
ncbi:hypothetical protein J7E88_32500 [Streptomyces sp. ISL-10]|nr:hypothetical protein [Streptomyces sp. ISL-10]MBT2369867.1 hypothetical protein [Streptomyces sp. ISL-10]